MLEHTLPAGVDVQAHGVDFEIQYKEESATIATNALSRRPGTKLLPMMLSNAKEDLLELIKEGWSNDSNLQ